MIEQLQRTKPELVERFLQVRDAAKVGIPAPLAHHILELNEASNLFRKFTSINECANQLRRAYPHLSLSTCKNRIYDAINYFNCDSSVTAEAWNNYFADKMMELFETNMEAQNYKEARLCMERARDYRKEASSNAINPDLTKFRTQLVSPDVELERMGIRKAGILNSYKKAMDIINSRDISSVDKERIKLELDRELNIEEAEYEGT